MKVKAGYILAAVGVIIVAGSIIAMMRAPGTAESGRPGAGPLISGSGGSGGVDSPRPSSDRGAGGKAPGIIPNPADTNALPEGHPAIEPPADEKSQVSIQWIGQACFYIQSPQQIVVVTDPFDPGFTGYGNSSIRSHIVTVSHEHPDHNAVNRVQPFAAMGKGDIRVVRDGTYHRGDVTVTAIPSFHDAKQGAERGKNRIFLIESGALRIAHLGDLGHVLTSEQVSALGRVDILLIPVGGTYTIGPDEAYQVVEQLHPRLVIPMHYRTEATDPKLAGQLKPVTDFTVKFSNVEFTNDFVALVAGNTLPRETAVWVLKARG